MHNGNEIINFLLNIWTLTNREKVHFLSHRVAFWNLFWKTNELNITRKEKSYSTFEPGGGGGGKTARVCRKKKREFRSRSCVCVCVCIFLPAAEAPLLVAGGAHTCNPHRHSTNRPSARSSPSPPPPLCFSLFETFNLTRIRPKSRLVSSCCKRCVATFSSRFFSTPLPYPTLFVLFIFSPLTHPPVRPFVRPLRNAQHFLFFLRAVGAVAVVLA